MGGVFMGDIIELLLDIILAIADHKSKKQTQKDIDEVVTYAKEFESHNNEDLFLLLMMITHIYFFDDRTIDRTERNRIKKLFQEHKSQLTEKEASLFRNAHHHIWSIHDIKFYIEKHEISEFQVYAILAKVKQLFYNEWEYEKPFQELSKGILPE